MKLSVRSVCSDKLTKVYKLQSTSFKGTGYIDLNWSYMGQLAIKYSK